MAQRQGEASDHLKVFEKSVSRDAWLQKISY